MTTEPGKCQILVPSLGPGSWKDLLADPDLHWRTGYSACALASSWENAKGVPEEIMECLATEDLPSLRGFTPLMAIPEHKVDLPGGKRPSQNDIWLLARTDTDLVSVAVEGKVNESFGPYVADWLKDASEGKQTRLRFLQEKLGLRETPASIRYQLLHRSVSAILEAERLHCGQAMMIVHSFSQEDSSFTDYADFIKLFCNSEAKIGKIYSVTIPARMGLFFLWVRGEPRFLSA